MSDVIIYHNGRCGKSRAALKILQVQGIPHAIRWYLAEPLSEKEIKKLLKLLGMQAPELARKGEAYYKEHLRGKDFTGPEWISALAAHPELIERPIVVHGDKAIIARPPERLLDIL